MPDFMPSYVYGTPEWEPIKDVPEGNVPCDGCNGSGTYYGAGMVVNGHFVGYKGTCYRCNGKGSQTPADIRRNRYYDAHRVIHLW